MSLVRSVSHNSLGNGVKSQSQSVAPQSATFSTTWELGKKTKQKQKYTFPIPTPDLLIQNHQDDVEQLTP